MQSPTKRFFNFLIYIAAFAFVVYFADQAIAHIDSASSAMENISSGGGR